MNTIFETIFQYITMLIRNEQSRSSIFRFRTACKKQEQKEIIDRIMRYKINEN